MNNLLSAYPVYSSAKCSFPQLKCFIYTVSTISLPAWHFLSHNNAPMISCRGISVSRCRHGYISMRSIVAWFFLSEYQVFATHIATSRSNSLSLYTLRKIACIGNYWWRAWYLISLSPHTISFLWYTLLLSLLFLPPPWWFSSAMFDWFR